MPDGGRKKAIGRVKECKRRKGEEDEEKRA